MTSRIDDVDLSLSSSNRSRAISSEIKAIDTSVKLQPEIISNLDSDANGLAHESFTLESLLSGATATAYTEYSSWTHSKLPIDVSVAKNLSYFGSLYSRISSSINKILDGYPNGVVFSDGIDASPASSNVIVLKNSDASVYSHWQFGSDSYLKGYKLGEYYSGTALTASYNIVSSTATTTGVTLELDAPIIKNRTYYIYPSSDLINSFYKTLDAYELDLLSNTNRSNSWPRDSIVPELILCAGDAQYSTFLAEELNLGLSSDNSGTTDILWSKLFAAGATFDNDSNILQKLIQVYATTFDEIKAYQDYLAYFHSVGYSDFNRVPSNLVDFFAKQIGWSIINESFSDDYLNYVFPSYEHYSQNFNISNDDINFERWRRLLTNIVWLYKSKGTKKSLQFILDLYNIPEDLAEIRELIDKYDLSGGKSTLPSESNIVIPISGFSYEYVVKNSTGSTITGSSYISNTKMIDISLDPTRAQFTDYWNWGKDNHPAFIDINGRSTIVSGTSDITRNDWEQLILQHSIPSDGSADQLTSYPVLEDLFNIYIANSGNKYQTQSFEEFMDFVEANIYDNAKQVIPASTRLVGVGRVYKNSFFYRPKLAWQKPQAVAIPAQPDVTIIASIISASSKTSKSSTISATTVSSSSMKKATSSSIVIETSSKKFTYSNAQISVAQQTAYSYSLKSTSVILIAAISEKLASFSAATSLSDVESGSTLEMSAATFYPYSGQYGTNDYSAYTASALITTSNKRIDIPFSATSLSQSGVTALEVNLYRKLDAEEESEILSRRYAITKIISDNSLYGHYRVSPVSGLAVGDYIRVFLDNTEEVYSTVKITEIYTISTGITSINSIRTKPGVGIYDVNYNYTFQKIPVFFDWSSPIQTIVYDNSYSGNFAFPALGALKDVNNYSMSGSITLGGLTPLFGEILLDRREYFLSYGVKTTVISSLTAYTTGFETYSGMPVVDNRNKDHDINGILYRGNYFAFMDTPNSPEIDTSPISSDTTVSIAPLIKFKGVGDSDKLKLQFFSAGTSSSANPTPNSYTLIPESSWTSNSIAVSEVDLIDGATDSTIYSNKTTLQPNSWYWWRVLNYKRFQTMWGYVLETYTASEPLSFSAGGYSVQATEQGEVLSTPTAPSSPSTGKKTLAT